MPNVAKVFKTEITRISRKEIKTAIGQIGKSHMGLKKTVVDLKKRLASLEKENKRLMAETKKQKPEFAEKPLEEQGKARITAKGIRSLRRSLRLTQADFAKLVGTTTHSVYLWENKDGGLKLRDKTREALLSIRGMGVKEAKEKLAETEPKSKRSRKLGPKKRKRL
jgi:DNA-binding transcriptional regulator YiaG